VNVPSPPWCWSEDSSFSSSSSSHRSTTGPAVVPTVLATSCRPSPRVRGHIGRACARLGWLAAHPAGRARREQRAAVAWRPRRLLARVARRCPAERAARSPCDIGLRGVRSGRVDAVPRNARYMLGLESPPSVSRSGGDEFHERLAFSLDFWWAYLFYLHVIPPLGRPCSATGWHNGVGGRGPEASCLRCGAVVGSRRRRIVRPQRQTRRAEALRYKTQKPCATRLRLQGSG